jgi:hypothetical protein
MRHKIQFKNRFTDLSRSIIKTPISILTKTGFNASNQRRYNMNWRSQMQGGKKQFAFGLLGH